MFSGPFQSLLQSQQVYFFRLLLNFSRTCGTGTATRLPLPATALGSGDAARTLVPARASGSGKATWPGRGITGVSGDSDLGRRFRRTDWTTSWTTTCREPRMSSASVPKPKERPCCHPSQSFLNLKDAFFAPQIS